MYVRSTMIDGDPRRVDDAIAFVRDTVLPFVEKLDGNMGLTMLVNRSSGRTITSTGWADRAAMEQSLDALRPLRSQAGKLVGGEPVPEQWEVAERQRVRAPQPGYGNRSTRVQLAPEDIDLLIDTYRTTSIPSLSLLPGYCAAMLLVDRTHGVAVSTVAFDSRAHLEESRRKAAEIRQASIEKAHAKALEVFESDIAIAALRMEGPRTT